MFKKFLCLLISILALSSMGCVSAHVNHYDCNVEVGTDFSTQDCYNQIDSWLLCMDNIRDFLNMVNLCHSIGYWDFHADTVGNYDLKIDWKVADPDYIHFHCTPHPSKIVMDYDPFTINNRLCGMVYIKACDPVKTHPGDYEFKDTPLNIVCINEDAPNETYYANVNSTSYGFWELSELNWNLKPGNTYMLGVSSEAKGNWSAATDFYSTFIA
jgi:hypothetical protein